MENREVPYYKKIGKKVCVQCQCEFQEPHEYYLNVCEECAYKRDAWFS